MAVKHCMDSLIIYEFELVKQNIFLVGFELCLKLAPTHHSWSFWKQALFSILIHVIMLPMSHAHFHRGIKVRGVAHLIWGYFEKVNYKKCQSILANYSIMIPLPCVYPYCTLTVIICCVEYINQQIKYKILNTFLSLYKIK